MARFKSVKPKPPAHLFTAFFLCFLAVLFASLFLASCRGKSGIAEMDFPPTFVVESENRFAVVIQPYAVLLDEPGEAGITLSHCRRGDVFAVTASRFAGAENNRALWVCLEEGGWILRDSVILFSSMAQAEQAAQEFRAESSY